MSSEGLESFKFNFKDIGIGLLESITLGLYREPGDVLREYISNEIDTEPPPKLVNVRIEPDKRTVIIAGDGPGMDWERFRTAVKVGISPKDPKTHVGFRGIGIWAGVAVCKRLVVATKHEGDEFEYELQVDCEKLRSFYSGAARQTPLLDVLNQCAGYRKRPSSRAHGTEVTLEGILESFEGLLDEKEVREYLMGECPLAFEDGFKHVSVVEAFLKKNVPGHRRVRMKLNDKPVKGLHIEEDTRPPMMGEILVKVGAAKKLVSLGFYWMAHARTTDKIEEGYDSGLRVRIKDFTVVSPGTLSAHIKSVKAQNTQFLNYWVGEVHCTHPQLKPNSERKDLEQSTEKELLLDYLTNDLLNKTMVPISRFVISPLKTLQSEIDKAKDLSTTVDEKEFTKDKMDLYRAISEAADLQVSLRNKRDDLEESLKTHKDPSLEDIEKSFHDKLKTEADRASKRLTVRLKNLQDLQAKLDKKGPGTAKTTATSTPAKKQTQTTTTTQADGSSKPAPPMPPDVKKAIDDESARLQDFADKVPALANAVLTILYQRGVVRTAKDVRFFAMALVKELQRQR